MIAEYTKEEFDRHGFVCMAKYYNRFLSFLLAQAFLDFQQEYYHYALERLFLFAED